MSVIKFAEWKSPQTPIEIEYSLAVIEEIRKSVTDGFQRFSRGGLEVGGILYGTHDQAFLRIEAVREIACEHALGPSLQLSPIDKKALADQLIHDKEDLRLAGFVPLGWFVSHPRTDISLQTSDIDTYNAFFPEPWQVTLIVRPGRGGNMRAGFFVREPDLSLKSDRSYLDFNFPELPPGVVAGMGAGMAAGAAAGTGGTDGGMPHGPHPEGLHKEKSPGTAPGTTGRTARERAYDRTPQAPRPPHEGAANEGAAKDDRSDRFSSERFTSERFAPERSAPEKFAPESPADLPHDFAHDLRNPTPAMPPSGSGNDLFRSFGEPPPLDPNRSSGMSWIWLVVAMLLGAFATVAGVNFFGPHAKPEPLSLAVLDQGGQLQIQWNHNSASVLKAAHGSLEIIDGDNQRTFTLSSQELAQGNFTYARVGQDVQVRMIVQTSDRGTVQEASRFLGSTLGVAVPPGLAPEAATALPPTVTPATAPPPAPVPQTPAPPAANSPDVSRLQRQNAQQRARIEQLERTIIILQGRLGVSTEQTIPAAPNPNTQ